MCYSSQIRADYRKYVRLFGADMSIKEFFHTFWERVQGNSDIKIPKAMEAAFDHPQTEDERQVKELIDKFRADQTVKFEQELFAQRKRLADAERALQVKATKAASESQRIATSKVAQLRTRLEDLKRTELLDRDSRIFPGVYAPVMVMQEGKKVILPMRYGCRPQGKPAFYDTKYPGTYNARRDNLEGFWKGQFGHTHGVLLVTRFYENVDRDGKNVVLEFNPDNGEDMLVACLWSRWTGPKGEELLSFAAITDEPPPEVAAAGHDRCIIPLRPENVDAWLNPDPKNLKASYAVLDDKERPYYEHRLAA